MGNSDHYRSKQRFRELLAAKCNDALDEEGVAELEKLLLDSPEAREQYWQALELHADLERELAGKGDWDMTGPSLEAMSRRSPWFQVSTPAWFGALAACLLVVAALGYMVARDQEVARNNDIGLDSNAPVIGRLEAAHRDSRWSFGRTGDWNSTLFRQGDTITLDAGTARLRFSSDTTAVLRAPLVMQAVKSDRVRLLRGRMKVEVAKGAEGFAVETSSAEIIDLGTVFSVGAEDSGTDVVVLDGNVDLKHRSQSVTPGGAPPAESLKRLRAGEAIHVNRDGTLSRIVDVNHMGFSNASPTSDETALIKSVRDNIVREDMWSFYEIVPEGIREDAKCYVDRGHEWNGATGAGIPAYLLGADYVKTFCDDKVTPHLVIELTLRSPATVYILLDNRLEIPEWLRDRFEDTGDDIGIDEVDKRGHKRGVGPGVQVERKFSIWKAVSPKAGTVLLGPNGKTTPEQQLRGVNAESVMYGIAAKRLDI